MRILFCKEIISSLFTQNSFRSALTNALFPVRPEHCMSFTRSSLPIGKDRAIKAIDDSSYSLLAHIVNVLLRTFFGYDLIITTFYQMNSISKFDSFGLGQANLHYSLQKQLLPFLALFKVQVSLKSPLRFKIRQLDLLKFMSRQVRRFQVQLLVFNLFSEKFLLIL